MDWLMKTIKNQRRPLKSGGFLLDPGLGTNYTETLVFLKRFLVK